MIVIFLTDGPPAAGETDPDRIVANVTGAAARSVRLFAFGVGYDVDTMLLDQLSSSLRGVSAQILSWSRRSATRRCPASTPG